MFPALEANLETDLREFSRLLWQRRISHRIVEHEGRQVLLAAPRERVGEVRQLFQAWQHGEVRPALDAEQGVAEYFSLRNAGGGMTRAFAQSPLTLLLIAVCIALAFLAPLAAPTELTFALLFPDFSYGTRVIVLSRVIDNFSLVQLGKMLSPILLHGGVLHLAFNMLWLWELGRRIETKQSTLRLGATIVVLGLVSNTVQYLYGGGNNFGGMSGVVYGLFAYIWMWQLFDPKTGLNLPGSLIGFMLVSLLIMTLLQLNIIANEAHLGGFLCGVLYGAATALVRRLGRRQDSRG